MVNIKELSIGNSLIHKNEKIEEKIIVYCIESTEEEIGYATLNEEIGGWANKKDFLPIPITEELLSKIGYEENKEFGAFKLVIDDYLIGIYKTKHEVEEKLDIYIFDGNINLFHGYIKFIHQLQNAIYFATGKELNIHNII